MCDRHLPHVILWDMNTPHPEKRERMVFRFSAAIAALAVCIVFVLTIAQAYVRWSVNQNFTFLGGNALEALTVSSFGLVLGLAYIHRRSHD